MVEAAAVVEGATFLQQMQASGLPPWILAIVYFCWQHIKGQKEFHADFKKFIKQTSIRLGRLERRLPENKDEDWEWEYLYEEDEGPD